MKRISFFTSLFILLISATSLHAQSDLEIFGFVQSFIKKTDGKFEVSTKALGGKTILSADESDMINGSVQQANIFLRKELSDEFTGWVNFEILNNFSTDQKWGGIQLEEAWVNYQASDEFNIKAGLLIPRFNRMNEIKNRMPLIPYITRPLIFEPTLKNIIFPGKFLPERAFLQIYGKFNLQNVVLDYAAYIGNSEPSYANTDPTKVEETGSDTVNFKMYGGRVGLTYGPISVGFSSTYDKANYQRVPVGAPLKEDVNRFRYGFDLSFNYSNFFIDGEYIGVSLSPDNTKENINKSFFYGTLGYNFTEEIYGYASYSRLEDQESQYFKAGLNGFIVGAGYKPIPYLVLKAEFSTYNSKSDFDFPVPGVGVLPVNLDLDYKVFAIAASFMF